MMLFRRLYLGGKEREALTIFDLGSMDVNGCYRPIFDSPNWKYLGLDLNAGANVDVVLRSPYDWREFQDAVADVVLSGQAFEHIEFFWLSMIEIARVLRPGGICCVIAPAGGPEHRYPLDCWRFYPDGIGALARWVGLSIEEAWTDWDFEWRDSVLIARKPVEWRPNPAWAALRQSVIAFTNAQGRSPTRGGRLKEAYEQMSGKWIKAKDSSPRDARSVLKPPLLNTIHSGVVRYTYRGRACQKSPFDLALYTKLISEIRPATIFEIGSLQGGSALWFADLTRMFGLNSKIISIDVNPVPQLNDERVVFLTGPIEQMVQTILPGMLSALPHPWLVVEDASHHSATTQAVLAFFGPLMRSGEYIVVEDGIVDELGQRNAYGGGPNRAIADFLASGGDRFVIDEGYCDFYGHNCTYNTNGFIKRR